MARSMSRRRAMGMAGMMGMEYDMGGWMEEPFLERLETAGELADSLGIRYDRRPQKVSVTAIRTAYEAHGLFEDAARLLDIELSAEDLTTEERSALLVAKAKALNGGAAPAPGSGALEEARSILSEAMAQNPVDRALREQLAGLYEADDFAAPRLNVIEESRTLDLAYDASGRERGRALYELGRYDESWRTYRDAVARGRFDVSDVANLYRAGLAAVRAGDTERGNVLLRRALWRDPLHEMADEARELIDE
jgi:tetratricopeptide (TPR) repeat protein